MSAQAEKVVRKALRNADMLFSAVRASIADKATMVVQGYPGAPQSFIDAVAEVKSSLLSQLATSDPETLEINAAPWPKASDYLA